MKIAAGLLIGAIIGLALSYATRKLGSQCMLMCNPYVAASLGGAIGLFIVLGKG